MSEAKIDEFPCICPASREFRVSQRRVRSRLPPPAVSRQTIGSSAAEVYVGRSPRRLEDMAWLTDPQVWASLATLTALKAVLGIDNLVFIAIVAGRLPPARQNPARQVGLALARRQSASSATLPCTTRNSAPALRHDPLPVVRYDPRGGERSLDVMRWGLVPFWAKDIKVGLANINAKAEGIENSRPSARRSSGAAASCRSIIFMSGRRPRPGSNPMPSRLLTGG